MKQLYMQQVADHMNWKIKKKFETEIFTSMTKNQNKVLSDKSGKSGKWEKMVEEMDPYFDKDGRFDLYQYQKDQIKLQKYPKSSKVEQEMH